MQMKEEADDIRKRGKNKQEYLKVIAYKNERPTEENPARYLITRNWLNKWVKYTDGLKQGMPKGSDEVYIQKKFISE